RRGQREPRAGPGRGGECFVSRPSRACVDLQALQSNYLLARRAHGQRALAVVKANAYGHGAAACARALQPVVDGFAVAIFEEAQAVREAGIDKPVLVLEGLFEAAELPIAHALQLWLVVHHEAQLRMIETAPSQVRGLHVWLKIDTGMHRAGFAPEQVRGVYQRLLDSGRVDKVVFMTHFSCADYSERPRTLEQVNVFDAATAGLPGEHSLCNSAGLLAWPQARRHWARPGLMLYGVEPGDRP